MTAISTEWLPVIDQILAAIATTPKSLESICKELESAPTARTVYTWLTQDDDFLQRYARAKEQQLQVLADQMVELSDQDRICEKVTIKADGSREVVILDQVERTKLQIETRKWLLAKLNPKKYGDKQQVEHSGELNVQLAERIAKARAREKPE